MKIAIGKSLKREFLDSGHQRKETRPRPARVSLVLAIVIATLIVLRTFVADFAVVQGRSMLPSLGSGDIVFIFKGAYGLRNPSGGYFLLWGRPKNHDIVAAIRPGTTKAVIKRVWLEGGAEEDSYLLLGDNKYESIDSREFGPVPMNNILGRVLLLPRL